VERKTRSPELRKTGICNAWNSDALDVRNFIAVEVAQDDSETQQERNISVSCAKRPDEHGGAIKRSTDTYDKE
jgi:hypothetical protein